MTPPAPLGTQTPPHDPAALARAILAQPRFRIHLAQPPRTWWDVLHDWLRDHWNQLVQALSRNVHIGAKASVALGDVLVAVAICLVVVVGVRLLRSIARESAGAGQSSSALPEHADPAVLHAAAVRAAQRAEYAIAIGLEFRAALGVLDARGILRDDPARTVNECRRDVRARAWQLSAPFDAIARAFTAAVYAEDRVTAEDWSEVERAYAAFEAARAHAA